MHHNRHLRGNRASNNLRRYASLRKQSPRDGPSAALNTMARWTS